MAAGRAAGCRPPNAARCGRRLAAWALLVLAAWLVFGLAPPARAQQPVAVPPLGARVTDLTGTLDAAQRQRLEASLAAIEARKGAQVAVLMVPTTGDEPIEQFSLRVAEQWKLGRGKPSPGGKAVDDGVLVVVAKNDRRLRIEVGYGLEGAIPDAYAKRIVAETIAPRLRQGDFAGGLLAGVDEIARLIDGEALPAPWQGDGRAARPDARSAGDGLDAWLPLVLAGLVFGLVLTRLLGRLVGAGVGGLGAGLLGTGFGGPGVGLAVGLGVLALLLVFGGRRRAYAPGHAHRRGGVVPVFIPGGFGGGGFGGGGLGGGGFGGGGGFSGGGGSFGGGGASGDW